MFNSLKVKGKNSQTAQRTKILGEKDHAKRIYGEGNDFRDDHVYMPCQQNIVIKTPERRERTYQIVISNATMMSSLRINAVNEIATMFKNSFSNRNSAKIMIAAPRKGRVLWLAIVFFIFWGTKRETNLGRD